MKFKIKFDKTGPNTFELELDDEQEFLLDTEGQLIFDTDNKIIMTGEPENG